MAHAPARSIAEDVAAGNRTLLATIDAALAAIVAINPKVNAFRSVTVERACRRAREIRAALEG